MIIQLPIYRAIRYMVYENGQALRGFATQREAKFFAGQDAEMTIKQLPMQFRHIEVEPAPF